LTIGENRAVARFEVEDRHDEEWLRPMAPNQEGLKIGKRRKMRESLAFMYSFRSLSLLQVMAGEEIQ
jgi:hypothetical protein